MDFVRLGNSGLKITEITFGTALTVGTENDSQIYAEELIDTAWNMGIRSFDVSNNYGMGMAELFTGKALKKYLRQDYVLSTKGSWPVGDGCYYKGLSRKHIFWAFEESIKRLGVEYVDIYYAHRYDDETAMEEVARTFQYLIERGKVRYWATSEWPVEALRECHEVCEKLRIEKPIAEQFIYSYVIRKSETNGVKNFCDERGVGTLGFSPLAQGLLTGKYKDGIPENSRIAKSARLGYDKTRLIYEQNKRSIDEFVAMCDEYGVKGNAAALQWCIYKKVYPVLGASMPEQIIDNVNALSQKIPDDFWNRLVEFSYSL
jgi:aryl-alcohol dehydrogenase-like predicted oxidoreductase